MKPSRYFRHLPAVALLILTAQGSSFGQQVTKYTGSPSSLSARWTWATGDGGRSASGGGYWIGYGIERMMGEHSFTGSFYSDRERNHPTLRELLTGMKSEPSLGEMGGFSGRMSGNVTVGDGNERTEKMVKKEVGILFHLPGTGKREIDDVKVSNLTLHVDFGGDPLVWMGSADENESVALLIDRFEEASREDPKESILMAIGFHRDTKAAYEFLRDVLRGSGPEDLRGDAAFWLGQTGSDEARKILIESAMNDGSEEVREKAIFALSEMDGEKALDDLISVARKHPNRETRKHAAFWIGQKAGKKALGVLKDLAYNDEDTEVQRSAMFALTQIDNDGGVEELVRIAKNHPNRKIRKDAIFWLGQSEDPRALDVLVDIVKGR